MKIFVSSKPRRHRKADYCWVPEGEIVMFPSSGTGWIGVLERTGTTTAKVIDVEMTEDDLYRIYCESITRGFGSAVSAEDIQAEAREQVKEVMRITSYFPTESVVSYTHKGYAIR